MPKVKYTSTKGLVQESGPTTNQHPVDLDGVNRGHKARNRYYLEEYFAQRPCLNADLASGTEATREPANRNFEVLGTNMTSTLSTFDSDRGGIKITTAGADQDQAIVLPHLDTNQTAWTGVKWGTENYTEWECAISTNAIDNQKIWAGLKLTNDQLAETDADQIYFKAQTDATNGEFLDSQASAVSGADMKWSVIYSIGGVVHVTNTDIAVTANTTYNLKIVLDSDRRAACFINGTQVGLQTHCGTVDGTFGKTGVQAAAAVTAADSDGNQSLTVDQVDATTKIRAGDRIYKSDATLFGIVKSVSATEVVFETVQNNIADDDFLFSFGQKVRANESQQKSLALTDDVDLIPYIGIEAGAAAAEALDIHYCAINRVIFE